MLQLFYIVQACICKVFIKRKHVYVCDAPYYLHFCRPSSLPPLPLPRYTNGANGLTD